MSINPHLHPMTFSDFCQTILPLGSWIQVYRTPPFEQKLAFLSSKTVLLHYAKPILVEQHKDLLEDYRTRIDEFAESCLCQFRKPFRKFAPPISVAVEGNIIGKKKPEFAGGIMTITYRDGDWLHAPYAKIFGLRAATKRWGMEFLEVNSTTMTTRNALDQLAQQLLARSPSLSPGGDYTFECFTPSGRCTAGVLDLSNLSQCDSTIVWLIPNGLMSDTASAA